MAARLLVGVLLAMFVVLHTSTTHALVPDRRRDFAKRRPNEYLLIPAVASLPGIGVFAGIITAVSNIADTGINVGGTLAESIDDSDIEIQAIALEDIPLFPPSVKLDYQAAHIKVGNLETYLPGRDSPNFTIPVTGEFNYQFVSPTFRSEERRFNAWYNLSYFDGFDYDENGNEKPLARHGAGAGLLLDLTDDVVDPRIGVRFIYNTTLHAPRKSPFGENEGEDGAFGNGDDVRIRDYALVLYFPLAQQWYLAWANTYFKATGQEDSGNIVAGGSPPLRGYPGGRWSDRFGFFSGLDLRYNIPMALKLDWLLVSALLEDIQLAVFYEVGQVSPVDDGTLYEDLHHSYGGGVRALFEGIVLRLDMAYSDEGQQTHLTIGQAF